MARNQFLEARKFYSIRHENVALENSYSSIDYCIILRLIILYNSEFDDTVNYVKYKLSLWSQITNDSLIYTYSVLILDIILINNY